jgi:hypothetical protein
MRNGVRILNDGEDSRGVVSLSGVDQMVYLLLKDVVEIVLFSMSQAGLIFEGILCEMISAYRC